MARARPTTQRLCERLARARPTKTPASPKRSGPFRQLGEGCEHRLQLAGRERSECTKVQREEYKASTRGPPEGGSQKREREEGKGAELGPAGRKAHPLFPWPPRGEGRDPSPRALEELGQGKGGGERHRPKGQGDCQTLGSKGKGARGAWEGEARWLTLDRPTQESRRAAPPRRARSRRSLGRRGEETPKG